MKMTWALPVAVFIICVNMAAMWAAGLYAGAVSLFCAAILVVVIIAERGTP